MNARKVLSVLGYILFSSVSILITAGTVYLLYSQTVSAFGYGRELGASMSGVREDQEIEVVFTRPTSIDEAAIILERNGVIESATVFRIENLLNGNRDTFSEGTYVLNASMDSNQIVAALRTVVSDEIVITIREGFTIRNIADYLEREGIVTAEEFRYTVENVTFRHPFLQDVPSRDENQLEGYLFPDTYFIAPGESAESIASRMLSRFDQIWRGEFEVLAMERGMTMDEVIIKASIIEREARLPEERELVSAVIRNRLSIGMPLQMCSTVAYVLDRPRARLSYADLETDSLYNTYMHPGLPIGPIANPGVASIRAALAPADVNYLFFVLYDDETGQHYFTNNYDAFLRVRALLN